MHSHQSTSRGGRRKTPSPPQTIPPPLFPPAWSPGRFPLPHSHYLHVWHQGSRQMVVVVPAALPHVRAMLIHSFVSGAVGGPIYPILSLNATFRALAPLCMLSLPPSFSFFSPLSSFSVCLNIGMHLSSEAFFNLDPLPSAHHHHQSREQRRNRVRRAEIVVNSWIHESFCVLR